MRLDPKYFDAWFESLNGYEPFPWQRRLFLDWLCPKDPTPSRWPKSIDLPTASGKTSLIDLAVLALAVGAECARRRIAFVVDRRVVVDEASLRASSIENRLKQALRKKKDPLHEVAESLMALGGERPLTVATLRGGIVPDESWARSPAQPTVIVSTVDQVGSRLLFRAYGGHGPRSWPIQAGLMGRDTLIIVDEAHCAVPFCDTVKSIEERWQWVAENQVGKPLLLVTMTATPREKADFSLNEEDRNHPELGKRLRASKPARLVVAVKTKKARARGKEDIVSEAGENQDLEEGEEKPKPNRVELVSKVVEIAKDLLDSGKHKVVGVVVNRVADARAIHGELVGMGKEALLLTGRIREWDRRKILQDWLPKIKAGSERQFDGPVAVVATQCIEVGANIDFDALVTEIAPLDALRQRFGRLNRLGRHESCEAYIVATPEQVDIATKRSKGEEKGESASTDRGIFFAEAKNRDPIYGHALLRTWLWLEHVAVSNKKEKSGDGHSTVDFNLITTHKLPPDQVNALCQESNRAHPLLPAHIDLLAQTSPSPDPDPEISAFLHGTVSNNSDVTVVWRADLKHKDIEEDSTGNIWVERVSVQPPAVGEGCPVPVWEFRKWIAGMEVWEGGDIEGVAPEGEAENAGTSKVNKRVLRWRGPEDVEVIEPGQVRPGDVIIVPSEYGGYDGLGWSPVSRVPVLDIGDVVSTEYRKPVLRLEAAKENLRLSGADEEVIRAIEELDRIARGEEDLDLVESLMAIKDMEATPEWLKSVIEKLLDGGTPRVVEAGGSYAIVGRKGPGNDAYTYGNEVFIGKKIGLTEHANGVKKWVENFCKDLDLESEIKSDMCLAAIYHDLGKADYRFQVWLHGGNEIEYIRSGELLAKSTMIARDPASLRRARDMSGYPRGGRHEAQSVALLNSNCESIKKATDNDLVLHLIESHHGYGRPFIPYVKDEKPVTIETTFNGHKFCSSSDHGLHEIHSGVPARFWRLVRKYGWWGLAYLEAVFRLADQRQSEYEQER